MIGLTVSQNVDLDLFKDYPEVKGFQITVPHNSRNTQQMLINMEKNITRFREAGYWTIIHAPFWINVCNHQRKSLFQNSINHLKLLGRLGARNIVTHVGCYYPQAQFRKEDIPEALFAESIAKLAESYDEPTKLLIENTVGNRYGSDPGSLENILAVLQEPLGVCVDSCHLYTGDSLLLKDIEGSFDTIHLNPIPEKHTAGSHRDRHGKYALTDCLQHKREDFLSLLEKYKDIPVILENSDFQYQKTSLKYLRG